MKICHLTIRHFKSIKELTVESMDNAFIVIGKNSVGKTVILDAILAVWQLYAISKNDFNEQEHNIEIDITLSISDTDLEILHSQGRVSLYKRYELWFSDFCSKLPSFKNGMLSFTFIANKTGRIRYYDGTKKNNTYIFDILPKIYYIDHSRNIEEIQSDILMTRSRETALGQLKRNRCMFDGAKPCISCFQCIGIIEKKTPKELTLFETEKLLEYKILQMDLDAFLERLNEHFHKNSGFNDLLMNRVNFDIDSLFKMDIVLYRSPHEKLEALQDMSAGMKSMYILSLLETYIETGQTLPCIVMIEDPEIFLHPQLQKVAGEILYRLSGNNQVIFSTHSPSMIFNFNSRQIGQIAMDHDGYTIMKPHNNITHILNDLGYSAEDLMNVSFVFIVEGKQDKSRLPLLLNKYYSEIYDEHANLQRIAIISTNSCTNIKTYANLKYINQLYLKDQFLMIRDGDGKDPEVLKQQLCHYYKDRENYDQGNLPRVQPRNVLILKYYSFENYFLDPKIMAAIGIIDSEETFFDILYDKYQEYLYRLKSFKYMQEVCNITITCKEDLKDHMEEILTYGRGHNLFDIFYGRYKGDQEIPLLKKYIDLAPRETFKDILDAIDNFIYFDNRKKED